MPATLVRPPLVKEAKISLECSLREIKSLGENGGAGQLIIANVIYMHIAESILNDAHTEIIQQKMHYLARMGGNYYCVINERNLFEVERPNAKKGIGFDNLPEDIKNSNFLSGNELGMLANVSELPAINPAFEDSQLKHIIQYYSNDPQEMEKELHLYAKELLQQHKIQEAWQILLA